MWHKIGTSILLQLCKAGEKGSLSLNIGTNDASQSYFGKHNSNFWPLKAMYGGVNGAKNKDSDVLWFCYIFFIFLKDLFYKLSLGCNTSHNLMIFLWKLIKNSYSAIKNLKKLWLQAKFSNFCLPLVPIKNILWFSHNKWEKHLISSKKDLSLVPMFATHNDTLFKPEVIKAFSPNSEN